jgi:RNA polymerase sigma-70 factor, ECF subfamily
VKTGARGVGVPNGETPDERLMRALVRGEQRALGELYDRYADVIFRVALIRLGDRQLAEEVLQDTYLALWNRAELFDPQQGSLLAWLSTIARNRAIDRLRSLHRRPVLVPLSGLGDDESRSTSAAEVALQAAKALDGGTAPTDPAELLDGAWLRDQVGRALAGIPEQERQVIHLAYYEELTQTEIAARLNWPLGTVKTRTRRALGRLRQALAGVRGSEQGQESSRLTVQEEADGPR